VDNIVKVFSNIKQVAASLKKKAKQISSVNTLSVEDASRHCMMLWKSKMPSSSGRSMKNIYYTISKKGEVTTGKVISPANMKRGGFLLNLFLEGVYGGGISPGTTSIPKAGFVQPYKLRHGVFGAGVLAARATKPFFKGLIVDRVRGVL